MAKAGKRFWAFVRMTVVFAILTGFFAYSYLEIMKMGMKGTLSGDWNQLYWYHPAVFWYGGFSRILTSFFGIPDSAKMAQVILRTIKIGFVSTFLVTEIWVILAGREWALRRADDTAPSISAQTLQRPSWYLIRYGVCLGVVTVLGNVVFLAFPFMSIAVVLRDIAVFRSLILIAFSVLIPLCYVCIYGLFRMKRWGFWGLTIAFLLMWVVCLVAGAPLIIDVGLLWWLGDLLLVIYTGGQERVWNKMR